jgi:hypothetical protein
MRRNVIDRRFKNAQAFARGSPLGELYVRFVREVVLPAVRRGLGDSTAGILYQRKPNFRCHLPDTGTLLVDQHCDADSHHHVRRKSTRSLALLVSPSLLLPPLPPN